MKKLIVKFAKKLAKELMAEQVKNLQDPKTEEKIAEAIAKKIPDWKEYDDAKQKAMLVACVDAMTDFLAVSMDMEAD
jgi:anaerobic ribonucleoside-triphosphate reductase|tara:strand:+ start:212 stop:442 length:231 start_codon:yes stop_codon:yes gene_type:complete